MSSEDKKLLKDFGIDIEKYKVDYPYLEQSFHFGKLTQVLGDLRSKKITYGDFIKYLEKGQFIPLNSREKYALELAKNRTYSHIKNLGARQKQDVKNIIYDVDNKQALTKENVVKEEIERGIKNRKALTDIVGEVGKKTGDWQRDWGRIVDTESNNIFQEARALEIMDKEGRDARVYKDVFPGVCRHCIKAYLTDGIGSQPRIFKLDELIANGTNIGRKVNDWKPTLPGLHPYCRCTIHHIPDGYKWNEKTKQFEPPIDFERKVERKRKDKITVGDKVFYV